MVTANNDKNIHLFLSGINRSTAYQKSRSIYSFFCFGTGQTYSGMLIQDFNHTIDIWIKELELYDSIRLCTKPSANSWSLAQVYIHLIDDTNYYIDQIKICVCTNDNINEEASPDAKTMFLNNDFPDEVIEGAPSNAYIQQPDNKEQVMRCLLNLKDEMNNAAILISKSSFQGKTKHPGLNYFNANEWFRFAEMHFRHHLRQKKRIDDFLIINSISKIKICS